MLEHACKVGISEAEYWECSPRYVAARIRGRRAEQVQQYENAWEQARLVAWSNLVPHDSKKKLRKPQDFLRFPWEKGNLVSLEMDEATRKVMEDRLAEEAAKFFAS